MQLRCALFLLLCCGATSSHLRRDGGGKGAEMDDVLKVAQHAHQAGDIYVKAKVSLAEGRAGKDVYLAHSQAYRASQAKHSELLGLPA